MSWPLFPRTGCPTRSSSSWAIRSMRRFIPFSRRARRWYSFSSRRFTFRELDKMEDIRADVRAGATSERNTIAETRSREIGGYGASHRYDAAHRYAAAQRLRGAYNRKRDLSWRFDLNSV